MTNLRDEIVCDSAMVITYKTLISLELLQRTRMGHITVVQIILQGDQMELMDK